MQFIYLYIYILQQLKFLKTKISIAKIDRNVIFATSVEIVERSSLAAGRVAPVDWSASLDLDATRLEEQCAPARKLMRF